MRLLFFILGYVIIIIIIDIDLFLSQSQGMQKGRSSSLEYAAA